MHRRDRLVETSRLVVLGAFVVNRAFLLLVFTGLLLSWVLSPQFRSILQQSNSAADLPSMMTGLRLEMSIGIVMALATDRLLSALGQLVASARAGDPFVAGSASRLQSIGWSLLVLQVLDIPAALLTRFFPSLQSAAPTDGVSVGGWIAVLMVFVLSRVFGAGSAMRNELEATV